MAEFQKQVRTQFIDLLRRLSLGQRVALGAVAVGAVAAIVVLVTIANKPSYGILFSNLAPQDAAKIVEKLQERKLPYQLEDAGKTILIPKEKIYDVRLSLAGEGLPQSSIIGYEIFDRTNLGMSDFVQKVNYRRAMEGELARTILGLEEVEAARVHIVVPEKTLFREDAKPTTASVVLKLKSGKPLRQESLQGIIHLVASSVEGLEPGNVTIIDSRGTLLSDTEKSHSLTAKTGTQYELQQKVESYLVEKAQSMLEGVVGIGNARVQVTAELDFRQVERTLEQYDPDKTVVRSEQITEEKNVTKDSSQPSTRSNTVTNYEINKTIEHIIENVGGIKRLSVAAVVNSVPVSQNRDGQMVTEYQSRKPEEMDQLREIVKRAVGYDSTRNDEVSVVNLPFGTTLEPEGFLYRDQPGISWQEIFENKIYGKIFLLVAMGGAAFVLWRLLSRFRGPLVVEERLGKEVAAVVGALDTQMERKALSTPSDMISDEARTREERTRAVTTYIEQRPKDAGRLLKVWLADV
jgi:flagellar M-ring protein FliF